MPKYDATPSDISIVFDDVEINTGHVPPQIVNGELFLPVDVFEQFGFEAIVWDFWHTDGEWIDNTFHEVPGSGRDAHMAYLYIDYLQFSVTDAHHSQVHYFAWVSPQSLRNFHIEQGVPSQFMFSPPTYTQFGLLDEVLNFSTQPQVRDVCGTCRIWFLTQMVLPEFRRAQAKYLCFLCGP